MIDLRTMPGYFECLAYHCVMHYRACAMRYRNAHEAGAISGKPGSNDGLCRSCQIGAANYRLWFHQIAPEPTKPSWQCATMGCTEIVVSGRFCAVCRDRMLRERVEDDARVTL
jgi:hypothetical protein